MSETKNLKIDVMRSFLGRARGLGSVNDGFNFWWMQRLTSIALLPLALWFIFSVAHLAGAPYAEARAWASGPVHATLLIVLIVVVFEHMHLGIQVVAEDYMHTDWIRMTLVLVVKAASLLLAVAAIIAVLKLAITG